jgi:hypothetical protein
LKLRNTFTKSTSKLELLWLLSNSISVEEITQNAPIARLLELCTEWENRSEKEDEEYKLWLPNFLEEVAQEKGGFYALLFAYLDGDEENDPANGKYRCLYPLFPIPHAGVTLVTRDVKTLEHEVFRFLTQLIAQRIDAADEETRKAPTRYLEKLFGLPHE